MVCNDTYRLTHHLHVHVLSYINKSVHVLFHVTIRELFRCVHSIELVRLLARWSCSRCKYIIYTVIPNK